MIPTAEMAADFFERQVRQLTAQVHAHLACQQDTAMTAFRLHMLGLNLKITSHLLGDSLHGQWVRLDELAKMPGHGREIDWPVVETNQSFQLNQGTFQLP